MEEMREESDGDQKGWWDENLLCSQDRQIDHFAIDVDTTSLGCSIDKHTCTDHKQ